MASNPARASRLPSVHPVRRIDELGSVGCRQIMNTQASEWQTKELSKIFLEGVRGAIPGADLQFEVIAKITQVWCRCLKSVLDLGCGNGILGRYLLTLFPSARGH